MVSSKNIINIITLQSTLDAQSQKLPGHAISRQKMNILKDSAILSLKDFTRMKNSSYLPSLTTPSNLTKSLSPEISISRALEHKKRILDYDRKKKELNNLLSENKKINERYPGVNSDDEAVRTMDKMILYARISTVRDKQLKEKKEIEKVLKKKEEKIDLMVEIERLKELKNMKEKDDQLQEIKKEGKKILLKQIEDNKKMRLKQKEIENKERLEMLKKIEEDNKKILELNMIKKKENEKKMQESLEANKNAILLKEQKILQERQKDLEIQKYNLEKYKKEEEAFQLKKKLAIEKELELQKLREKQEKAQDNQEIIDAIRAKRAFESENIKQRLKDKEDMLLKEKRIKELLMENNRQKMYKEIQLAEEAQKEKEEFNKIIKEQQKEIQEQKEKEKNRIIKLLKYKEDLKKQIAQKEEQDRINRREVLEEGRKNLQINDQYIKSIEAVRRDKIQFLKDMNIDEKYIVPLRKFKLTDLKSFN